MLLRRARVCSVKRAGMKKRETPVDLTLFDAEAIAFTFTGEPADAFDARAGAFALDAERADLDLRTGPVRHTLSARGSPFHRARRTRARETRFSRQPRTGCRLAEGGASSLATQMGRVLQRVRGIRFIMLGGRHLLHNSFSTFPPPISRP
jgi:hypothetical protein